MYGIAYSAVQRRTLNPHWRRIIIVYIIASTLGGAMSGALLGLVGLYIPTPLRIMLASIATIIAIILGLLEILGWRVPVIQRDCETPSRWVTYNRYRWALYNGIALGCGATTRIGFWLWYIIPTGALLLGSPVLSALIYSIYGTTRGIGILSIIMVASRWSKDNISIEMVRYAPIARQIASGYLLLIGIIGFIIIGF